MSVKKKDLPAQPFYWGDWFKAIDVQALPRETRCVWFEMIGRMWESNERGYLTMNGKPMSDFAKASALGFGSAVSEYLKHEKILEDYGIFSRRESDGAIYSRKILNYIELSEKRAEAGSKGGKKTWRFAKAGAKDFALANTEYENETENEYIITSSKGGEGGNQDEDIQKLNVYWSANLFPPKIAHKEFVDELYKKFGIEKTKQIIKKFSEGNFRNLNTMKESLDENGNIKPRDQINRGNTGTKPDIIKSSGGASNFDPSKSKYKIIGGAGGEPS